MKLGDALGRSPKVLMRMFSAKGNPLEGRLQFIERFYDVTVAPLKQRKRLIETNEEPYRDTRDPEDYV